MEGERSGGELVKVAYARDRVEGEMIHGLLENAGIPSLLEQARLNVDEPQLGFGQARALLAEALVEVANAEYLEDAGGGRARNYGVVGAYARAMFWSLGIMALAFGAFLLLRVA